jgi:hypothetical protein
MANVARPVINTVAGINIPAVSVPAIPTVAYTIEPGQLVEWFRTVGPAALSNSNSNRNFSRGVGSGNAGAYGTVSISTPTNGTRAAARLSVTAALAQGTPPACVGVVRWDNMDTNLQERVLEAEYLILYGADYMQIYVRGVAVTGNIAIAGVPGMEFWTGSVRFIVNGAEVPNTRITETVAYPLAPLGRPATQGEILAGITLYSHVTELTPTSGGVVVTPVEPGLHTGQTANWNNGNVFHYEGKQWTSNANLDIAYNEAINEDRAFNFVIVGATGFQFVSYAHNSYPNNIQVFVNGNLFDTFSIETPDDLFSQVRYSSKAKGDIPADATVRIVSAGYGYAKTFTVSRLIGVA